MVPESRECCIPLYFFRQIKGSWKSIVFVSALSVVLEYFGVMKPLTEVSMFVVSHLGVGAINHRVALDSHAPLVVVITDADYQNRYLERSPVDTG